MRFNEIKGFSAVISVAYDAKKKPAGVQVVVSIPCAEEDIAAVGQAMLKRFPLGNPDEMPEPSAEHD